MSTTSATSLVELTDKRVTLLFFTIYSEHVQLQNPFNYIKYAKNFNYFRHCVRYKIYFMYCYNNIHLLQLSSISTIVTKGISSSLHYEAIKVLSE